MNYFIAYLILTFACFLAAPAQSFIYKYSRNVWTSFSQLLNSATGGNPDHTFSGRAGRGRREGSTFWRYTAAVIDQLFRDKNHCRDSIEYDEQPVDYGYSKMTIVIYTLSGAFSVYVGSLLVALFM